ncbi:CRISPR-associated RAMP protein [Oscillochloris sp. ZM17-4]|uniref:type III CRISPR-associated RAMP protein Csx7 n=1 Tax=Oscillochloris sp. ZM17-4 TaxID=2866714 RepID=UPI001C738A9B|nr:CRISPR-associated RAMP protein Csx7 [Oscillochloris sp. ZM17-4]MBX0329712.1 CRISPR-associated RAMP protein [Oscillochloris sp. ZM17-4]
MDADLFRRLERRYLFTGELTLRTALHLGGGDATLGSTDSPVVRRADGQPFIPGSSIKGAFRSTVEKLAVTIGLPNMEIDVIDAGSAWMKTFTSRRREEEWTEEETIAAVAAEWPATAHLFGTLYTASKASFSDAYLVDETEDLVQRRDGVAIDRDSERAMDRMKYDYEVVPPTVRFRFELLLENPGPMDLGLTCLGLSELRSGFFSLGGKRSSGMGRCLLESPQAYELDLTTPNLAKRAERLGKYLRGRTPAQKFDRIADFDAFLDKQIEALVKGVV